MSRAMQSFSKTHSWAAPQPCLVPFSPDSPNVKLCGQWAKGSVPVPGSEAWAPPLPPPRCGILTGACCPHICEFPVVKHFDVPVPCLPTLGHAPWSLVLAPRDPTTSGSPLGLLWVKCRLPVLGTNVYFNACALERETHWHPEPPGEPQRGH